MTVGTRRTQAERRAVTRTALLDATIEVLADVGYARLTTAGVCARAGVTRGAQAHYFATKADLVVQALLHLTEEMVGDLLTTRIASTAGVRAQYAALLDRLWEIFSGRRADAHLELLVAARTDDELRRHLGRLRPPRRTHARGRRRAGRAGPRAPRRLQAADEHRGRDHPRAPAAARGHQRAPGPGPVARRARPAAGQPPGGVTGAAHSSRRSNRKARSL